MLFSDVADFIEDDFAGDSDEDDTSVVSSTTSLSTGKFSARFALFDIDFDWKEWKNFI